MRRVLVRRQRQDARLRLLRQDAAHRFEPAHAGHRQVHHQHIGFHARVLGAGLLAAVELRPPPPPRHLPRWPAACENPCAPARGRRPASRGSRRGLRHRRGGHRDRHHEPCTAWREQTPSFIAATQVAATRSAQPAQARSGRRSWQPAFGRQAAGRRRRNCRFMRPPSACERAGSAATRASPDHGCSALVTPSCAARYSASAATSAVQSAAVAELQLRCRTGAARAWLLARAFGQVVQSPRPGRNVVQHQRRQARDDAVHRVVQARCLVGHQARRLLGLRSSGSAAALRDRANAMLRIAVTDWPSSSCSSRAIMRRSCSMWTVHPARQFAAVGQLASRRAPRGARSRCASLQFAHHAVEGWRRWPPASWPGSGGSATSKRPAAAARSSAATMRPNGLHRSAHQPEHEQMFTATSIRSAPRRPSQRPSSSQASSTAREALERTTMRPSGNVRSTAPIGAGASSADRTRPAHRARPCRPMPAASGTAPCRPRRTA